MKRLRQSLPKHLTYANVVATLALFLALSGGATAIAISLGKNSVTTKSIKNGAVRAKKLGPFTIRADDATGPSAVARAACLKSERVLSGGGEVSSLGGGTNVLRGSAADGNGWSAAGANTLGAPVTARAVVLCLAK